jgi:hypothetical protein
MEDSQRRAVSAPKIFCDHELSLSKKEKAYD